MGAILENLPVGDGWGKRLGIRFVCRGIGYVYLRPPGIQVGLDGGVSERVRDGETFFCHRPLDGRLLPQAPQGSRRR